MTQPLQPLHQRLIASRSRLQLQRLLLGMGWGLLVAAGLYLLLNILRWFGLIPASLTLWLPIILLLVGLIGYAFYLFRTAPNLSFMAQQADRHFGLQERLSTALEFQNKPPRDTVHAQVYKLLIEDAAASAQQVNPQALIRFRWPRTLLYALGIGVLAFALQFVPTPTPKVRLAQDGAALSAEEQATTVTQLARVAKVVQQDAERKNDPYLQATVRSIERLKADIQAGRVSAAVAEEEILRLSERLEKSYNLPKPSGAGPTPAAGTPDAKALAEGGAPQINVSENGSPQAEPKEEGTQAATQVSTQKPSQALSNLAERLENQAQNRSEPKAPNRTPQAQTQQESECGPETCSDQYALARAQQAKDLEAAAKNAIKRPPGGDAGGFGDQAGKGEGGGAGARGEKLPEKANSKEVRLPFQAPKSGRRIQIMGPPSADSLELPPISGEVKAQNWTRQEEVPISLGYLETRNRGIVSQYFLGEEEGGRRKEER